MSYLAYGNTQDAQRMSRCTAALQVG